MNLIETAGLCDEHRPDMFKSTLRKDFWKALFWFYVISENGHSVFPKPMQNWTWNKSLTFEWLKQFLLRWKLITVKTLNNEYLRTAEFYFYSKVFAIQMNIQIIYELRIEKLFDKLFDVVWLFVMAVLLYNDWAKHFVHHKALKTEANVFSPSLIIKNTYVLHV